MIETDDKGFLKVYTPETDPTRDIPVISGWGADEEVDPNAKAPDDMCVDGEGIQGKAKKRRRV